MPEEKMNNEFYSSTISISMPRNESHTKKTLFLDIQKHAQ
jgi:hypothetical protein